MKEIYKFKTDNPAFLAHCEKAFLKAVDLYKLTSSCKGDRHCTCSTTVLPLLLELSNDFCTCCYQHQKHHCTCTCSGNATATTNTTNNAAAVNSTTTLASTSSNLIQVPVQHENKPASEVENSQNRSKRTQTNSRPRRKMSEEEDVDQIETYENQSPAEQDDNREPPKTPKRDKGYKGAIFTLEKDGFHICMDVKQFRYNELSVRVIDGQTIVLEAKHGDREDETGTVARSVVRKYQIPRESDPEKIEAELSSDYILTVKAPLRKEERQERVIKIKQLSDEASCQNCPCMTTDFKNDDK